MHSIFVHLFKNKQFTEVELYGFLKHLLLCFSTKTSAKLVGYSWIIKTTTKKGLLNVISRRGADVKRDYYLITAQVKLKTITLRRDNTNLDSSVSNVNAYESMIPRINGRWPTTQKDQEAKISWDWRTTQRKSESFKIHGTKLKIKREFTSNYLVPTPIERNKM